MRLWTLWLAGACGLLLLAAGCRAPSTASVAGGATNGQAPDESSVRVRIGRHSTTKEPDSSAGRAALVPAAERTVSSRTTPPDAKPPVTDRSQVERAQRARRSSFAAAVAAAANGRRTPRKQRSRAVVTKTGFQTTESPGEFDSADANENGEPAVRRFEIPPGIPGAEAPRLELPAADPQITPEERRSRILSLYGELLPLPPERTNEGVTLSLQDFEQIAFDYNPKIRAQWAAVQSARGAAVQAGLYPNPDVGYQSDTVNTGDTAGYHGGYLSQTFITAGKLDLATQVAQMKVRAREYEYRRIHYEVAGDVRRAFFAVLIADERLRLARAMSTMTEETYQAQVELVIGSQAAAYEPMQLRVQALTARNALTRAENQSAAAWRELGAAIGQPDFAPTSLAGSVDVPTAAVSYDSARSIILTRHTDLSIARARIAGANCNLQLQRNTPIPNINFSGVVQYDDTSSRNDMTYNLQLGVPLPLFNRNQGNISSAQADLTAMQNRLSATRNDLVAQLAANYRRYSNGRQLAQVYRTDLLPSQVQAYRGVYERFRAVGGDVDFAQVVLAQQTLNQVISEYLDVLAESWQATADLSELLQVDNAYTMDGLARDDIDGAPPQVPPANQ